MDSCPFCEIVAGDREAHVVLETDRTVAFLDANPATAGHTLVVPAAHRDFLFGSDASLVTDVFGAVHRVVRAMDRALEPDGVSLFYTTGDLAGQVTHAHVHVLPREVDDGIRLSLPRESLDATGAGRIAAALREHVS